MPPPCSSRKSAANQRSSDWDYGDTCTDRYKEAPGKISGSLSKASGVLFAATILISAFLLFQVQPLIARLILPWFGGSAAVWTSCMLFFQLCLLAGYGYAHWLARQPGRWPTAIHLGLMALSLLSLPILPSASWKPLPNGDPLLRIAALLVATVGLPYFLLSTTSPLLQSWYSRAGGRAMPYRFFALSNLGSMLGLLTYPVLVEPNLTNKQQAWMWSATYITFAVLIALVVLRSGAARRTGDTDELGRSTKSPSFANHMVWVGLGALPSALLLALTNHMTQNVAPIPFLWVLPLSLYLLSFILCFSGDGWYGRELFAALGALALPAMTWALFNQIDIRIAVSLFSSAAFVVFMICHGELAIRRPAPQFLTSFYFMVSLGGATGGLLIALFAPYVFSGLYDLPLVISCCGLVFAWLLWRDHNWKATGALAKVFRVFTLAASLLVAIGIALLFVTWARIYVQSSRVLVRNFYGALRVHDVNTSDPKRAIRVLVHGTIAHGVQFLDPARRQIATAYFDKDSGIARAIRTLNAEGPVNVGVVGLGAGTLAAYARPLDHYTFYEINPLMRDIANSEFSFLAACKAPHEVVLGDARLVLEQERPRQFDLLVADAFSGDSIPIHLLTREAFSLYWRHLKPDGVLAVQVSNRYVSIGPVVALAAAHDRKKAVLVRAKADPGNQSPGSEWILISSRPGFFDGSELRDVGSDVEPIRGLAMWTDDFSNLYKILRYTN
jgi:spermidine synthase